MSSDKISEEERLIVGGRQALHEYLDIDAVIDQWAEEEGTLTEARATAKAALDIAPDSQAQKIEEMAHAKDVWDNHFGL